MELVYFLRANLSSFFYSRRVTGFHQFVFHGTGEFPGHEFGDNWIGPSATNNVRDVMLHISRSGAVVPDVFSPRGGEYIVSPVVQAALKGLPGIQFHPVVFEHVVDLAMPPLGVWPTGGRVRKESGHAYYPPIRRSEKKNVFRDELLRLTDVPDLRAKFDGYAQLLPGILIELDATDKERVPLRWGTYRNEYGEIVHYSPTVLSKYAIYSPGGCNSILSEDAFTAIAPFLNLDYYDVAVLDLRPEDD